MNLNANFDLYRTVKVGDFNPTISYELTISGLCRISLQSMREQLRDGDNNILTDHSVILEYSEDVQKDDIIVIGENAYRINSLDDPDEMHHHLELGVLKLQPGFMG
jgi:head-tail adaptor